MKPCRGCGGSRSPGRSPYCDECREQRQPLHLRAQTRRTEAPVILQDGKKYGGPPEATWPEGKAWCKQCQSFRPRRDFSARKTKRGIAPVCRPCESNQRFTVHLASKYGGMTVAQYDALLARQGGGCAICGTRPKKKRLAVDHDHRSGRVRGLLCKRCNHDLLGAAHDSVDMLEKAIRYLKYPPASTVLSRPPSGKRYVRRRNRRARTLSS